MDLKYAGEQANIEYPALYSPYNTSPSSHPYICTFPPSLSLIPHPLPHLAPTQESRTV